MKLHLIVLFSRWLQRLIAPSNYQKIQIKEMTGNDNEERSGPSQNRSVWKTLLAEISIFYNFISVNFTLDFTKQLTQHFIFAWKPSKFSQPEGNKPVPKHLIYHYKLLCIMKCHTLLSFGYCITWNFNQNSWLDISIGGIASLVAAVAIVVGLPFSRLHYS